CSSDLRPGPGSLAEAPPARCAVCPPAAPSSWATAIPAHRKTTTRPLPAPATIEELRFARPRAQPGRTPARPSPRPATTPATAWNRNPKISTLSPVNKNSNNSYQLTALDSDLFH